MNPRSIVALLALLAASACSEPLEFADWTIPVPDGTPLKEYEVALLDDRDGDRIEIVEDLVIGSGGREADEAFYRARGLVVDAGGRIYVLDSGNHRVQVFEADGTFLRSFGKEGQGPGEFVRPEWIALAGDVLAVNDPVPGRVSVWSLDGEHIEDHSHGRAFRPDIVRGSANGTLVAGRAERRDGGLPITIVAEFSLGGAEISLVAEVPIHGHVRIRPGPNISESYAEGYNGSVLESLGSQSRFAVARDGALYLAAGDEYQVLALAPSGDPRWAVRATMPMQPFPIARIDDRVRRNKRARSRSDYDWDEFLPTIDAVQVDGHGHLWVYPTVRDITPDPEELASPETRPVDVYSSAGELLYSGAADSAQWHVSLGEFVYRLTVDRDTEEQIVVRYRLVEPFE